MNSTCVIIPSYKPTNSLIDLCRQLSEIGFNNIMVVNDGSPENFLLIFNQIETMGIKVVHLLINSGKGVALKKGISQAIAFFNMCEYFVFCDDDLQHSPKDVYNITTLAHELRADFVLGERDFRGLIPWKSKLGNLFINWLVRIRHSIDTSDSQTGLRCVSKAIAELLLSCKATRFGFEIESLLLIHYKRIRLCKVPIKTIYYDNNRLTRFKPILDSLRVIWVALSYPGNNDNV